MAGINPIPPGCNSVNVYLIVKDGQAAIDFYSKAFGATGGMCMTGPDGKGIMHAELQIGNSTVMLSEENPQCAPSRLKQWAGLLLQCTSIFPTLMLRSKKPSMLDAPSSHH